ncbi:hypothetical protein C0J52_13655 [Blattella germanica]|nr:hypothetical protein C0J52_13655 [Blattella germanica]
MHHIQQDTIYINHNTTKKESIIKWQHQWDITTKGAACKSFLPKIESRNEIEDSNYSGIYIHHYWPWQNKSISTQVQVDRQSAMPLQQG